MKIIKEIEFKEGDIVISDYSFFKDIYKTKLEHNNLLKKYHNIENCKTVLIELIKEHINYNENKKVYKVITYKRSI